LCLLPAKWCVAVRRVVVLRNLPGTRSLVHSVAPTDADARTAAARGATSAAPTAGAAASQCITIVALYGALRRMMLE
jgi:hypothetical protein